MRSSRGFTLLELITVLVIAALLMAVAPPMISAALPGVELKGTVRQLSSALRYARDRAVLTQTATTLTLDLDEHWFQVSGRERRYRIPQALELQLTTARSERTEPGRGAIRFFPNGAATGGRITITYKDSGYRLDVDWLTGQVRLTEED